MTTDHSKTKNFWSSVLVLMFAVFAILMMINFLYLAISTGTTTGKLGAIHTFPEFRYFVGVFAYLLGILMSGFLVKMCWKWIHEYKS